MTRLSKADQKLLTALREGDEQAFGYLVNCYHNQMLRIARMFASNPASAEEVVQETWLAVIKGIHQFEGRSSLKTWIFRILTNRAKTRGVREGRHVSFSDLGDTDMGLDLDRFAQNESWAQPPTPWSQNFPESLSLRRELRQFLTKAVEKLPENQRLVLTLRDIQGWDTQEVCNLLEVSHTNQRVLLHRARTKVRSDIEKYLKEPKSK